MTPTAQSDIRRSRVHLDGEAILHGPDGDWRAPLRDLSVSGLNVRRPAGFGLPVGQAVEVELHCGPPEAAMEFLLLARVARTGGSDLGLRFAPMPERMARALERLLSHYGRPQGESADETPAPRRGLAP